MDRAIDADLDTWLNREHGAASATYVPANDSLTYNAFLGAPLLRGGRAIGVLVVQNRSERRYDDEEVARHLSPLLTTMPPWPPVRGAIVRPCAACTSKKAVTCWVWRCASCATAPPPRTCCTTLS